MEAEPNPNLPPAGWYPDPSGQPSTRWWSGVDWTEHLQPVTPPGLVAPSTTVVPAPSEPVAELVTAGRSGTPAPLTGQLRLPGGTQPHYYRQETGAIPINTEPAYEAMASAGYARNTYTRLLPSLPVYTASVWWYALTPLWLTVVGVGVIVGVSQLGRTFALPGLLIDIVASLITIGLVRSDRNALIAGGHNTAASAWWWLLGPIAYLIARGIHVKRATGKGFAPLVAFFLSYVIVVAALAAVLMTLGQYLPPGLSPVPAP